MTDHLDQAADRAEKLARAITDDGYEPNSDLIGRIAQHLMYLAGLIRGGAVQPGPPGAPQPRIMEAQFGWGTPLTVSDEFNHAADGYRKRWHEAATQRDALVRAALEVLNALTGLTSAPELAVLRLAVEKVESGGEILGYTADRLRRELWAVLDRMPASDDDLIATVKQLVDVENAAVKVERFWKDWPSERRAAVRQLSQHVADAIVDLVSTLNRPRQ